MTVTDLKGFARMQLETGGQSMNAGEQSQMEPVWRARANRLSQRAVLAEVGQNALPVLVPETRCSGRQCSAVLVRRFWPVQDAGNCLLHSLPFADTAGPTHDGQLP